MRPIILLFILSCSLWAQSISVEESVLTQHNDTHRTGVYNQETVLTRDAVKGDPRLTRKFGRLCIRKVNGQIAGQPLFVKGVMIDGQSKDVLYVATRKNFVYAFDTAVTTQIAPNNGMAWKNAIELTYKDLKAQPLPGMDDGKNPCHETHGPVGITSTPVIDQELERMYLVFRVAPGGNSTIAHHVVVAIDIKTGKEIGRNLIRADGFESDKALNRPGLLLMKNPLTGKNVLYVGFGAPVCDHPQPFQGWVFAYAVNRDAPYFVLLDTYQTAPQTRGVQTGTWTPGGAGIWQSGAGLAGAEKSGFVYAMTGNNIDPIAVHDTQTGLGPGPPTIYDDLYHESRTDLGESILRLQLGPDDKFICEHRYYDRCVTEHFTADNWLKLDLGYATPEQWVQAGDNKQTFGDSDLGSGGPVILPNGWVVGGGKQGKLYVIDPSDMKHARQAFQLTYNSWHVFGPPCTNFGTDNPSDHFPCSIGLDNYDYAQAYGPNIHGAPVVWDANSESGYIYAMGEKDFVRAYKFHKSVDHKIEIEEYAASETFGIPSAQLPVSFQASGLRAPDGMPGGFLSLSTNHGKDAILWVSVAPVDATTRVKPGVLLALNAETLELLW